jgi:hypothetical protein
LSARILGWPSAPPLRAPAPHENEVIVVVVVMEFPADPAVLALTVTPDPLELAVTVPDAALRLIASLRLFAIVVVSVAVVKLAPVLSPSAPPVSVPAAQEKPVRVFPSAMLFPAAPFVRAVIVVVALLAPALTPKDVAQALTAAARFVANVLVVVLVAKVAVASVGQPFEPSAPALTPPHEKRLLDLATVSMGAVPGVKSVTIVWLVLPPVPWAAVALTAEKEL